MSEQPDYLQEQIKVKEKVHVKPSWFEGYKKGNEHWPQTGYPGISILTYRAVLDDPPSNWEDFSVSELTSEQINKLGEKASIAHTGFRIDKGFASKLPEFSGESDSKAVVPREIETTWKNVRGDLVDYLARMAGMRYPYVDGGLDTYFKEHPGEIDQIKAPITIAADVLSDEPALNLASLHKLLVLHNAGWDHDKWYEHAEELRKKMKILHDELLIGRPNLYVNGDIQLQQVMNVITVLMKRKILGIIPDFEDKGFLLAPLTEKER